MNNVPLKNAAIFAAHLVVFSYCTLPTAQAVLLDGNQITTAFYFPDQNTIGFGGVPVMTTVGPGVEIAASPQGFPIASLIFQTHPSSWIFSGLSLGLSLLSMA